MSKHKYKITVFTATYNREHTLNVLYNSLINQTFKDFEWLIVDDGSTDGTKEFIERIQLENKLNINYHYKNNGGKHRAINLGVKLAKGELFFIVDSDDYLVEQALETIRDVYSEVKSDPVFAGISGLKVFPTLEPTGGEMKYPIVDSNALDIRMKYCVKGDLAEVYKTIILENYPFPDIADEKFCAEGLIWNRIAQKYKIRYTNRKIYVCEYLEGGLSNMSVKNRINSPTYATTIYKDLFSYNIPFNYKIKAGINFWRFAFYRKESFLNLIKEIGWLSLLVLPISVLFYLNDKKNL
jgi:glycosyltransferase involved in cell wall biosynthesis